MSKSTKESLKEKCEADLYTFARWVNPNRIYGSIHKKLFRMLQKRKDQLILLPRGHQKSHCVAVYCAWRITCQPDVTILYTSATEMLAILQLSAIKDILTSENYRQIWPEMIHDDEGKREQWAAKAIKVDHPLRKQMGVRDSTVAVGSVGSNTVGLHCDELILDDLVVPDNAYTDEGRASVSKAASQFESVKNPGAVTKVVGTRYHPRDLYQQYMDMVMEEFDAEGNEVGKFPVFEIMSAPVEVNGVFTWPRSEHPLTKRWEGFDDGVLARKRAGYISLGETAQFYAQYYNDPNDPDSERVKRDAFEYYDVRHLVRTAGTYYFKGRKLNVFAAADIAYTTTTTADYTAIVVIGIDCDGYIYVLDLDRFKTSAYEEYYRRVEELYNKWGFRKMRIETNGGAVVIAEYIKDRVREKGMRLGVEGKPSLKSGGRKEERIAALLEPNYMNKTILHFEGGLVPALEEEIVLERPRHDDLKDALAACIEIATRPAKVMDYNTIQPKILTHPRFGGVTGIRG